MEGLPFTTRELNISFRSKITLNKSLLSLDTIYFFVFLVVCVRAGKKLWFELLVVESVVIDTMS